MKYTIINGGRFTDILSEDSTYPSLKSNITRAFPTTRKRQHIANTVRIKKHEFIPMISNGALQVSADVSSQTSQQHHVDVMFQGVTFTQENPGSPDVVTVTSASSDSISFTPLVLSKTNLRVRCTCMDFRFRFALWNFNDNSLVGDKPPMYVRKTTTRPPANPDSTPGVCKHIIKVVDFLVSMKVLKR